MKKVLLKLVETLGAPLFLKLVNQFLTVENIKKGIDDAFDVIEDTVKKSPNKIDDMVVLPVLKKIRTALDVPDND